MKEFDKMNLKPELLESLKRMDFKSMTEVQEKSMPLALQRKDLVVRSKTGSGKTIAFLVPIFQGAVPAGRTQALIVVPTRELALQVCTVADELGRNGRMRSTVVYGGASINIQIQSLRRGADVVIGTPGRILDLVERGALELDGIRALVLDEADMMLDMGFIEDIERIILMTPKDRQTMLFSATMPREIRDAAIKYMKYDAVTISVGEEEHPTVETISHSYYIANGKMKVQALLAYIEKLDPQKCIIFTSTQRESEYVHRFLNINGFHAILMHGGLTQAAREQALQEFRMRARFLISTNLASRGLDVPDISDIINFDAPADPRIYVHRIGRSARMGKNGRAFTIFGRDQEDLLHAISRSANVRMDLLELETEKFSNVKLPAPSHGRGGRGGFGRSRGGFNRGASRGYKGTGYGRSGYGYGRAGYGRRR